MNQDGKNTWWALGLIVAATLLVFSQSFDFGYVDYDDPAYVSGNPYVKQGLTTTSLRWAWSYAEDPSIDEGLHPGVTNLWHPLTWMSHMIDVECWGVSSPGGHHVTSVLLHLGSVVLVFLLFRQLFTSWWVGLFTALLFAVHPLHVEPVAWLSARKDQLSAMFMFASLYAYLRQGDDENICWKGASVICFVLALCSKPSVVVMPILLVLIDRFRRDSSLVAGGAAVRGESVLGLAGNVLRTKWLWVVPALLVAMVTLMMQQEGSHSFWIERSSLVSRLQWFAPGVGYYLIRTIVPLDLSFHYSHPGWLMQKWLLLGSALILVATVASSYRFRRQFPVIWFAVAWFLVVLIPVSGLVYVGTSFTADRYMYTALTGLFAAIAYGFERCLPSMLRWLVGGLLVAVLAVMSFVQAGYWKDSASLFTHAVDAQPADVTGYVNLGSLHQRDGNYQAASKYYGKALNINKRDYISWFNLGNCRNKMGDQQGAIDAYRTSLEIFPRYDPSRFNLAYLLLNPDSPHHDLDEASRLLKGIRKSGSYRRSKVDLLMRVAAELKHRRDQPLK